MRLRPVTWCTVMVGAFSLWAALRSDAQESLRGGTQTEEEVKEAAKQPYANDLGSDTIDVSSYPPQMQRAHVLFSQKCSRCHTLARPINSQWATAVFWEHYVKRMWRKPGSGINGAEAKQIWEFLVYDSQVRKLDHREVFKAFRRRLLEEFRQRYPARFQELYGGAEEDAVRLW
ncbi:MAG: hypothetical protein HY352_05030 [Candidatus Omnitrophica bacterium]|nr:hypothetical protein [Candidatus Omnitrophota bacterium]